MFESLKLGKELQIWNTLSHSTCLTTIWEGKQVVSPHFPVGNYSRVQGLSTTTLLANSCPFLCMECGFPRFQSALPITQCWEGRVAERGVMVFTGVSYTLE